MPMNRKERRKALQAASATAAGKPAESTESKPERSAPSAKPVLCLCSTHGLSSNTMALITSNCG